LDIAVTKARLFYKENRVNEALALLKKSYIQAEEEENIFIQARTLFQLSSTYIDEKQRDSAEKYTLKFHQFNLKYDVKSRLESSFILLGSIEQEKGNLYTARKYYEDALKISKEMKMEMEWAKSYLNLYEINAEIGDYKQALDYLKIFYDISDSSRIKGNIQLINELVLKYETQKKDDQIKQIEFSRKKGLEQEKNIRKSEKQFLLSAVVSLVLLFILISVLFIDYRNQQKRKIEFIEKEKITAELNTLKNQINPHIIFNILNAIYFLADYDLTRAKFSIEKFASILRYQLYECSNDYVSLKNEIHYVREYINLQSLRKSDRCEINTHITVDQYDLKIAPYSLLRLLKIHSIM
jgi:tetratricopeptide (TPR) repeat protein